MLALQEKAYKHHAINNSTVAMLFVIIAKKKKSTIFIIVLTTIILHAKDHPKSHNCRKGIELHYMHETAVTTQQTGSELCSLP